MRDPPGNPNTPSGLAQALRRSLTGNPFVTSGYQWGTVSAVHGTFNSALASAASAGAFSISTVAAPGVNALLLIGTLANGPNAQAIEAVGVSGSGPYDVALAQALPSSQVSGATVTDVPTVDLYLDGASQLTTGVRHLGSYAPQVNDVTAVARGHGGLSSDRFALGSLLPPPGAPGVAGELLALMEYAPPYPGVFYAISTASMTALDPVNLTVKFTTRASGPGSTQVLVRLSAFYSVTNTPATQAVFGLTEHANPFLQMGWSTPSLSYNSTAFALNGPFSIPLVVSGLSPDTAYQWDFAAAGGSVNQMVGAQGLQQSIGYPNAGPAVMEVWAGMS